jgi:hypothetical protein
MTPPIFSAFNAWVAAEPLFSALDKSRAVENCPGGYPHPNELSIVNLPILATQELRAAVTIPSAREGPVEGTFPVWVCPGFLAGCCSAGCCSDCGMRILRCLRICEILLQCPAHRGRVLENLDGVIDLAIWSIAVPMLLENSWTCLHNCHKRSLQNVLPICCRHCRLSLGFPFITSIGSVGSIGSSAPQRGLADSPPDSNPPIPARAGD